MFCSTFLWKKRLLRPGPWIVSGFLLSSDSDRTRPYSWGESIYISYTFWSNLLCTHFYLRFCQAAIFNDIHCIWILLRGTPKWKRFADSILEQLIETWDGCCWAIFRTELPIYSCELSTFYQFSFQSFERDAIWKLIYFWRLHCTTIILCKYCCFPEAFLVSMAVYLGNRPLIVSVNY